MNKTGQASLVKDPYTKTKFKNDKELQDFIKCCDPVTGYLYFMDNFFMIQHPIKGSIVYHPYNYQKRLINTYHNYRFSISLMPRQSGKSTSAAGYLLWYAMFVPDSTILIAAHKYTGAQEIMQRIRYAYENCPDHIKAGVTTYNKGSLDFENGSRIVSATTTENTGRGMSITLLYLDEFAFVRPSIAREFWTSITPTLATGGKAIITSTPNSDEDQFAFIWKGANKTEDEFGNTTELGVNGFKAYRASWDEQPGRDQKWADEIKAQLGEDRFRREIGCEFIIADETLINPNTLIDLQGIEPITRMGQVRWYQKPVKGNIYTVALDPSIGTGNDPAAIQIFEANTVTQVGEWKHNKTDIPTQIKLMAQINKYIVECTNEPNNVYYSVENNSIGEAALVSLNEYGENNIPGIFISEPGKKRKGFNTTNKTKLTACAKFKTLLESKKLTVNSRSLISELKAFVAHAGSYAAKVGDTDDLVMASLLSVRMIQELGSYHFELDSYVKDHEEFIAPLPFFAVLS
jgi:Terminase large subunit, T4likevirus-type, N-terminal/Terminase RNaseH-like domain